MAHVRNFAQGKWGAVDGVISLISAHSATKPTSSPRNRGTDSRLSVRELLGIGLFGTFAITQLCGIKHRESTDSCMTDVRAVVGDSTYREPSIELVKVATRFEDRLESLFPSILRIVAKDVKPCQAYQPLGQAARMGIFVAERQEQ